MKVPRIQIVTAAQILDNCGLTSRSHTPKGSRRAAREEVEEDRLL